MRRKFFEESILKHKREIERLQELLAEHNQQLNEQARTEPMSSLESLPAPLVGYAAQGKSVRFQL